MFATMGRASAKPIDQSPATASDAENRRRYSAAWRRVGVLAVAAFLPRAAGFLRDGALAAAGCFVGGFGAARLGLAARRFAGLAFVFVGAFIGVLAGALSAADLVLALAGAASAAGFAAAVPRPRRPPAPRGRNCLPFSASSATASSSVMSSIIAPRGRLATVLPCARRDRSGPCAPHQLLVPGCSPRVRTLHLAAIRSIARFRPNAARRRRGRARRRSRPFSHRARTGRSPPRSSPAFPDAGRRGAAGTAGPSASSSVSVSPSMPRGSEARLGLAFLSSGRARPAAHTARTGRG